MRKRLKKVVSLLLISMLTSQFFGIEVFAKEFSVKQEMVFEEEESVKLFPELDAMYGTILLNSDGIVGARIYLSYDSNGLLAQFSTTMSDVASVVGVKDIKISQSVWYGWKEVGSSAGGYDTEKAIYGYGVLYSGASAGQTFKASCVHYGTINGVSYELPNETSGFTCVDPNN